MIALASRLALPLDVVTQTIGILAKRRAGKSYTGRRLAEQLFEAELQVVIIDPKGDWWGIRSSADGKHAGLPIIILGGEHGDVPLEVQGGELVARLVVEQRVSVLLDLSLFRKSEVAVFMTSFLEALYRLKAREEFRTAMMLIIDEADAIAPQKPMHGEERMLGAAEDIVRRGGQRGIGCTFITQRSAVLNKNVLTQAQILVALRTIAPQDLTAMNAWIDVHGTVEERRTLMASLPSLPVGNGKDVASEAWFWSPGWPTTDGIFQRVKILPIETFDSGATPRPGEKRVEPRTMADIDLEALRGQMSATIEREKSTNPKLLQQRVRQLEQELKAARAAKQAEKRVEVPVVGDALLKRAHALQERAEKLAEKLLVASVELRAIAAPARPVPVPAAPRIAARARPAQSSSAGGDGFRRGAREMLVQLARMGRLTREQLATLAGMSPRSGTFSTYLGELRRAGYVVDADVPVGGELALDITEGGLRAAGPVDPAPPTTQALVEMWSRRFRAGGRAMLQRLVEIYPNTLSRDELGEAVAMSPASGTFSTYLGELRRNGLIENSGSTIRASGSLFVGQRGTN